MIWGIFDFSCDGDELTGFSAADQPCRTAQETRPRPQSVSVLPDRSWGRLTHLLAEKETIADAQDGHCCGLGDARLRRSHVTGMYGRIDLWNYAASGRQSA